MLYRIGKHLIVTLVAGIITSAAGAQSSPALPSAWAFQIASGKLYPTGAQRSGLTSGNYTSAQLSRSITSAFSLNASAGWARSHSAGTDEPPKLSIYTYDIGGELRAPQVRIHGRMSGNASIGLGVGGRSYDGSAAAFHAQRRASGYAAVGAEIGTPHVSLRVDVRNYVSGATSRDGVRNDVVVIPGLRIVRK